MEKEEKEIKEEKKNNESSNKKETSSNVDSKETITGLEAGKEAILIYLVPLLGFIFSFLKDKKVCKAARFHYNQAATSFIIVLASCILAVIPILGWVIATIVPVYDLIMRIIALVKALNGELYKIPVEFNLTKSIWHTEE